MLKTVNIVLLELELMLIINIVLVILGKSHYLLYTLAAAMQPRMLVTFDEDLNPLPVPVRVGLVSFLFIEYCSFIKCNFNFRQWM